MFTVFCIMAQDHMIVEDWVEEARKSLSMQQTPLLEQATFLCDLLDGVAKREIMFSSPSDRSNPEAIFTILLDNFACDQTYVTLQKQFFQRQLREHESIREFSQALLGLDLLKTKDPRGVPNPDMVLRDAFIENVCDSKLQRDLAHLVQQHPTHSFKNVCEVAIKLEKRKPPVSSRGRAYSCDSQTSDRVEGTVDTNAITVGT